jgi:group I intron endonuclease
MNYSIYKITNNVNQKVYIGFTEDIERRWKQHRIDMKKGKRPLYQAFRKYGLENFSFEVIFNSDDKEKTLLMEIHYIKEYDSTRKGYNLQEGGYSPTQENRELNRKRMLENNPMKDPEIKKKNTGMFVKGQKPIITEERNEKIRQSKLGSNNHNYGNSNAAKPLNEYVTCPNCSISMNKGNYKRWHLKKCHPV